MNGSPSAPVIPTKIDASRWPLLIYLGPMFAFLLLTTAEDMTSKALGYPLAYALKILLVAIIAFVCRDSWRDLRPKPNLAAIVVAVILGLVIAALWVGLDGRYPPLWFQGKRSGFDPSKLSPTVRAAFLSVRFCGLVILVPLIEELFWRSFLMRWLIDADFLKVPVGKVTLIAGAFTSIGFALEHPEWLPGLITGIAWAGLLAWSKSLSACVISHATANLALGLYVVNSGGAAWKFL
jgi:CAAX prenyl protease-like protein